MSEALDNFKAWFKDLSPKEKSEITSYICTKHKTANFGYYGGPAPTQLLKCPTCGKVL
jgi:hypothetical protein